MRKRIVAVILSVMMAVSLTNVTAYAAEVNETTLGVESTIIDSDTSTSSESDKSTVTEDETDFTVDNSAENKNENSQENLVTTTPNQDVTDDEQEPETDAKSDTESDDSQLERLKQEILELNPDIDPSELNGATIEELTEYLEEMKKGSNTPSVVAETEEKVWTYSKSKAATNLNAGYEANVTLSLPSAEEKLTTEVCFVLDESSFSDTLDKAIELLDSLKKQVEKTDAKVQVDVVGFKRAAYNHGSYDLETEYDKIKKAFIQKNSGGSNIHAGLLLAKEILAKDTSIPDSRKYMILVSDGDTYLYCKNNDYNTPYSRSNIPFEEAAYTAYGGFYANAYYYPSEPYRGNVGRPTTSDPDAWNEYLNDVWDRNNESNGNDYEYVWNYYDEDWASHSELARETYKQMPCETRTADNIDMAFYYAAQTYKELNAQYHCYSVDVDSLSDGAGHSAFMQYLNGGKVASFDNIQKEILYYLSAGSTVTDYMGYEADNYNFDLVDPSAMVLRVEKGETVTEYKAEKIAENHYGFMPNEDGAYSYEVIYTPGQKADDEYFTWKINTNVTNFERVSLTYNVKLMNPKTEAGTYGALDLNGDGIADDSGEAVNGDAALYTNTSAVLSPVNSNGATGKTEYFSKPSVTYTVADTTPTPDTTPSQDTTPSGNTSGGSSSGSSSSSSSSSSVTIAAAATPLAGPTEAETVTITEEETPQAAPKTGQTNDLLFYELLLGASALAGGLALRGAKKNEDK